MYRVYRWPITMSGRPLAIQQVGPIETVAGQGFNVQPNGDSAMWMMAENPSPGVMLVFGEVELPTVAGGSNVVTAAIPKKLIAQPGGDRGVAPCSNHAAVKPYCPVRGQVSVTRGIQPAWLKPVSFIVKGTDPFSHSISALITSPSTMIESPAASSPSTRHST